MSRIFVLIDEGACIEGGSSLRRLRRGQPKAIPMAAIHGGACPRFSLSNTARPSDLNTRPPFS
jgi:hypothetical protein